jgi:hypothetical protein
MSTKPQIAAAELPRGAEVPPIHCPLCGQAAFQRDPESGAWSEDPCAHLAFVHSSSAGDFVYQTADVLRRIDEREASRTAVDDQDACDIDGIDCSEPATYLAELGYGEELLAISITYGGMACGPVWSTDIYGYDLTTLCADD